MAIPDDEQEAGVPQWIVTFSDLTCLLLTFFVMLVSMSEMKQEQTMALMQSLQRQFGHSRANLSLVPGRFTPTGAALNKLTSLGRARRMNSMNGGDKVQAPVGDYPRVMAIRPSDESTLGGVIYFEEGSSELTDEHQKTLRQTAAVLRGKPQKIEIWGHTSSRPLRRDSPYRDHWELAYARSFKVMESLVALGIDRRRIRIGVAAENEPVHEGYDELLRKKNARVEVLMLDRFAEGLRVTPKEKAGSIRSQRQGQPGSSGL